MTRISLLEKLENTKLCKVKARMIRNALRTGACDRGNHVVVVSEKNIRFFYRGTTIACVGIDTLSIEYPLVGEYEHTASTSYHRKTIREAVAEIKAVSERGIIHGHAVYS